MTKLGLEPLNQPVTHAVALGFEYILVGLFASSLSPQEDILGVEHI